MCSDVAKLEKSRAITVEVIDGVCRESMVTVWLSYERSVSDAARRGAGSD